MFHMVLVWGMCVNLDIHPCILNVDDDLWTYCNEFKTIPSVLSRISVKFHAISVHPSPYNQHGDMRILRDVGLEHWKCPWKVMKTYDMVPQGPCTQYLKFSGYLKFSASVWVSSGHGGSRWAPFLGPNPRSINSNPINSIFSKMIVCMAKGLQVVGITTL